MNVCQSMKYSSWSSRGNFRALVHLSTATKSPYSNSIMSLSSASSNVVHEQPANNCASEELPQFHQTHRTKKIVLFGGNGYVGQGIVLAALKAGVNVVSISRSGQPKQFQAPAFLSSTSSLFVPNVEWKKGDISKPETYETELNGAIAVISCVGAFGSNEYMEKVNGDSNIIAISASKNAKIPRFVYISAVENNLPEAFLHAYFHGKRRTEEFLLKNFPDSGFVLRPGFIYGTRQVPIGGENTVGIPLWILGKPLEFLFSFSVVQVLRRTLPGMQAILAPPIARETLASVAVKAALGECSRNSGILTIEDILNEARRCTNDKRTG